MRRRIYLEPSAPDWLRQEAKALKRELDISHHEALEYVARKKGFLHWHEVTKAVKESSLCQEAFRHGFVFGMDIAEADDRSFEPGLFVQDTLLAFLAEDYFKKSTDSYFAEYWEDEQHDHLLFRYSGIPPLSPREAFSLVSDNFFFGPRFFWIKCQFIDPHDDEHGIFIRGGANEL
jgi:hypothetical protein